MFTLNIFTVVFTTKYIRINIFTTEAKIKIYNNNDFTVFPIYI